MQSNGTLNLRNELQKYGLTENNIRLFDAPESPELLDYLDLTKLQKGLGPDGVAESQGRPLLFFVDESELFLSPEDKNNKFRDLRRILACRGDPVYLAKVRPGELEVMPVNLADITPQWQLYRSDSNDAITFYSRLALGHFDGKGEPDEANYVFKEMLNLLNRGADRLTDILGPKNVLSLIGRALFFRFLCDRNIITESDTKRIAPRANNLFDCFDNAENAHATSQWLDQTFNGDFLPLEDGGGRAFFDDMARRSSLAFVHLKAIINRWKAVGPVDYQTNFQWSDFNFAHVPVGLLSQVYEAFCWRWERRTAKETSIYYTPRNIAAILVDEAFNGLPRPHETCVLDPACGGGVFLVLAFRRLYRERWKAVGRPATQAIREILETQIKGFDISDSALKLTALSLYLTAIELDPVPIPPEKLKFHELNEKVLFNHRQQDEPDTGPVIGSLGGHVGSQFDGQFDLVLSNPPWTSLPARNYKEVTSKYTAVSQAIITRRGGGNLAHDYVNPDNAPDLPFLWKSTEWCKPGGRIAMALPARILFKQGDSARRAREAVFRLIEVTGIINGSNLSDTEVWPEMSQPFMLFFARNQCPRDGQVMRLVTLHYDKMLNKKGKVRIDSKSAQSVELSVVFDEPWLLKTLAIGTQPDIEVIRKIKSAKGLTLGEYWKRDLGMVNGNGYQIAEEQKQKDATFLHGLPELNIELREKFKFKFKVDTEKLPKFTRKTLFTPRERPIYSAPLVLINVTPGEHREDGRALLAFSDVVYNESFNGYSAAGLKGGELFVRYLHLFVHSIIWTHYTLAVSAEFGTERRKFHKRDLDNCPIIPLAALSGDQLDAVMKLSERLVQNDTSVFTEIDALFGILFNLTDLDLEVIRDTLDVCLPYNKSRARACDPPTEDERKKFRQRLELVLSPFFKVLGKELQVILWEPDNHIQKKTPFSILLLGEQEHSIAEPDELFRGVISKLADDTGTTRIIQHVEGGLLIGLLNQYRYWTPSRARLLGAEIVRQHMSIFED